MKLLSEEAMDSMEENIQKRRDHLREGEFICPEEQDFVSDDMDDVMGHMLAAHEVEAFTADAEARVISHSLDYRTSVDESDEKVDTAGNEEDILGTEIKGDSGEELGQRVTADSTEPHESFYEATSDNNDDSSQSSDEEERGIIDKILVKLGSMF